MQFLQQILLVCIVCVALLLSGVQCKPQHRAKRELIEFGKMVKAVTNRNPNDFVGYGNWCAHYSTSDPVDKIDECCQAHDGCYGSVNTNECKDYKVHSYYTKHYEWTINGGQVTCEDTDACKKAICECDKIVTQCFKDNEGAYNANNIKEINRLGAMAYFENNLFE